MLYQAPVVCYNECARRTGLKARTPHDYHHTRNFGRRGNGGQDCSTGWREVRAAGDKARNREEDSAERAVPQTRPLHMRMREREGRVSRQHPARLDDIVRMLSLGKSLGMRTNARAIGQAAVQPPRAIPCVARIQHLGSNARPHVQPEQPGIPRVWSPGDSGVRPVVRRRRLRELLDGHGAATRRAFAGSYRQQSFGQGGLLSRKLSLGDAVTAGNKYSQLPILDSEWDEVRIGEGCKGLGGSVTKHSGKAVSKRTSGMVRVDQGVQIPARIGRDTSAFASSDCKMTGEG